MTYALARDRLALRRDLWIVAAAVLGFGLAYTVFRPGVMSPDSLGAYSEARDGQISGLGQSPIISFVWMWILKIWPGGGGMLALQNVLFWTGLALIVRTLRLGRVGSALAILSVGLFPPVFALLGVLWKDVLLGGSLTLCIGLTLTARDRRSVGYLAAAAVMLLLGQCFRANALPAVLVLAMWLVAVWLEVTGRAITTRRLVAFSLMLTAGVFAGSRFVDWAIVPPGSGAASKPVHESLIADLVAISLTTRDLRMPSFVLRQAPRLNLETLRQTHDTADANKLFHNNLWEASAILPQRPENVRELVRVWFQTIADYPSAYLRRRAAVTLTIFQMRGVYYLFHTGIDPNPYGLTFEARPLYRRVTGWLFDSRHIFFRGWMFACVATATTVSAFRRGRWECAAICLSGLLFSSSYVVISSGSDFRYIWWLVVSTLIGALTLVFGGRSEGRSA